jgi:hypothetical protein
MSLKRIPLLGFILIGYNILVILSGTTTTDELDKILLSTRLISGGQFQLQVSDVYILVALIALYIEIFRAARTSTATIIDHALSMLVFVIFLIQFIVAPKAGNPTFLILTFMSLLDVIAGFTVSLSTARRDFNFEGE